MTYLLTFACYGSRLHGHESGSVDRSHNVPGMRLLDPDPVRFAAARNRMTQETYELDPQRRELVLASMQQVCFHRRWTLLAAHVRSNHIHVVVDGAEPPERMLNALKACASRALNRSGLDSAARRRWSRHGSTKYLWKREQIEAAIGYVADRQGEPMAVYVNGSG